MGLGVWLLAKPERRGFFQRKPAAESLLNEAAHALCQAIVEVCPLLRGYVRAWQSESESDPSAAVEWLVRIHPAEEEVRIANEGGRILFSARTNGAGPGYHACLIGALDRVATSCRLGWVSADGGAPENAGQGDDDGDAGDETGYFEHRDFDRLRDEMLKWLRAIARHVVERYDAEVQVISMPMFTPLPEDRAGVLTPIGVLPRDFFEAVTIADETALERLGNTFFPWWQAEFSSAVAGKLARTVLSSLPWHPPESDDERALVDLALACLDSSPEALTASGIDDFDVAELRRLRRETPEVATVPRPGGFGELRGPVRWNPYPTVSLVVPGYFYQHDDDDAKVYWFGDREVRVTSFSVKRADIPTPAEDLLARAQTRNERAVEVRSRAPSDELPGYTLALVCDENDPGTWHASGGVARPGKLALVTITFGDRSSFDWAEEIVRSVRLTDDELDPD